MRSTVYRDGRKIVRIDVQVSYAPPVAPPRDDLDPLAPPHGHRRAPQNGSIDLLRR